MAQRFYFEPPSRDVGKDLAEFHLLILINPVVQSVSRKDAGTASIVYHLNLNVVGP